MCLGFAGAEEAQPQSRPLFSPPRPRWNGSGQSVHFLTDPLEVEVLHRDHRFTPSPHHGDRGWMAMRLDRGDIDCHEIAELLESAHRQVVPRSA